MPRCARTSPTGCSTPASPPPSGTSARTRRSNGSASPNVRRSCRPRPLEGRGAMSASGQRLRLKDGLRVASVGLRARPLRAALSALGIAIGTAAIVGVLGLSSSSQAGLIAEINQLGTNLLTVEPGQSLTGGPAQLPREAPARLTLLGNVDQVADTALIKNKYVYRSSIVPTAETGG